MILSSTEIQEAVVAGRISVRPGFDEAQLRPFGIRVHLGAEILVPVFPQVIDLSGDWESQTVGYDTRTGEPLFALESGKLVIGSTVESFRVASDLVCRLDGRSTLARLGVLVHCTAAVIDGNHSEHRSIVLEIVNLGPSRILIPTGYPVGMVMFERSGRPSAPGLEQAQYSGQRGALGANLRFTP